LDQAAHASIIEFASIDATNREQVETIIQQTRVAASTADGNVDVNITVSTRFFLHSIDESQGDLFLDALSNALLQRDEIRSEYRSKEDEALPKVYGKGHYRRYIDTPVLLEKLNSRGFEVVYEITGLGMAKFKEDDPFVSRFIVKKN